MKGAKQLRDMIYNILENSDAVSGVTLKNSPNSSTLLLDRADGKGRMTFYTLFPGMTLAFIFVNAPVWPESDENSNLKPLLINYCVSGRSELLLDDGSYIYLKENDFCVSEQTAQKEYIFPTKQYQGIKIYFDLSLLLQSCGELLKSFSLDLPNLEESYCGNHILSIRRNRTAPAIRRSSAPPSTGFCPAAPTWRTCSAASSGKGTN